MKIFWRGGAWIFSVRVGTRDQIERKVTEVFNEQSGFLKNGSQNKFRKIAYIEGVSRFFVILCITMYFHAIESSTFTKMGELLLKLGNFIPLDVSCSLPDVWQIMILTIRISLHLTMLWWVTLANSEDPVNYPVTDMVIRNFWSKLPLILKTFQLFIICNALF